MAPVSRRHDRRRCTAPIRHTVGGGVSETSVAAVQWRMSGGK